ncbi:hypothetical protein TNCV_2829901 [Trichonephila clavipes]|nr:hypothetical protein TNCV_2829901 [Trichonephila clavipes]
MLFERINSCERVVVAVMVAYLWLTTGSLRVEGSSLDPLKSNSVEELMRVKSVEVQRLHVPTSLIDPKFCRSHGREPIADVVESRVLVLMTLNTRRVEGLELVKSVEIQSPAVGVMWELGEFGLAIHQNDHQARRRFVEWAQNEIPVVPDFHKRILFSDEVHFWLNGYVNKQNCRIWSEANPQVYVETPLHPEKLTVWCALWADYFLWGYVKSLVYADKPQTLDHLEDNIRRVIADMRPQMLEKVIENWTSRLDYIRASRGSPMPEIIFKM